jgi:hypothetical protein
MQALLGNREDRGDDMVFTAIKNLDYVPVRAGVEQPHDILTGLQHRVLHLDGFVHGEDGPLVPLVRIRTWCGNACRQRDGEKCKR